MMLAALKLSGMFSGNGRIVNLEIHQQVLPGTEDARDVGHDLLARSYRSTDSA